jgi:hypothetical protein
MYFVGADTMDVLTYDASLSAAESVVVFECQWYSDMKVGYDQQRVDITIGF